MPPLDYRFVWNNHKHPQAILSYEMGVLSGGNVKDLTNRGNDGTPQNNPTYADPLIRPKASKSMSLDGINQHVLAGPVGLLSTYGAITIVCVLNPDTLGNKYLWNYYFAGLNRFGLVTAGTPTNWLVFDGIGASGITSPQAIIAGTTYHTVFTMDGTWWKLWVNGKMLIQWNNGRIASSYNAGARMLIGSETGAVSFYDGKIDLFKIHSGAFTPEQVWADYKSSIPR